MKQEKIHILSLLAALVASVIFGMRFMFSKLALAVAQPSVLLAFRFTVAVAAMTLVIAVNAQAPGEKALRLQPVSQAGGPSGAAGTGSAGGLLHL